MELIIDNRTCTELDLQEGDEIVVSVQRKAKPIAAGELPMFDRIIPESEWKQLQAANIKAALRQSKGKVGGPEGAARLLGVPWNTLWERIKRAGINNKDFG